MRRFEVLLILFIVKHVFYIQTEAQTQRDNS